MSTIYYTFKRTPQKTCNLINNVLKVLNNKYWVKQYLINTAYVKHLFILTLAAKQQYKSSKTHFMWFVDNG